MRNRPLKVMTSACTAVSSCDMSTTLSIQTLLSSRNIDRSLMREGLVSTARPLLREQGGYFSVPPGGGWGRQHGNFRGPMSLPPTPPPKPIGPRGQHYRT